MEILKQRKMRKSISVDEIQRISNEDCDIIMTDERNTFDQFQLNNNEITK